MDPIIGVRSRMGVQESERNELMTLRGIIRGPGFYATPSLRRVDRLIQRGWVKKKRGRLLPTLKGRLVADSD